MKIAITAHCMFCAQKFDAYCPDMIGSPVVCDDDDGKLCCPDCLCAYCGRGHATGEDYETCANESYVDSDRYDSDAFLDSVYDVHAGVI